MSKVLVNSHDEFLCLTSKQWINIFVQRIAMPLSWIIDESCDKSMEHFYTYVI
jgi:hypothetical protein